MKIAEFFASISLRPDPKGIREMNRMFRMMRGAAVGLGAFFGGGALAKGMLLFNSKVEDAKIQIAGMLALAKKTDLADQVGVANQLYDNLRKKAAELPGETQDYVNMLGMLVQPMANAGGTMEQMETLTVNAMIAARGLGEGWQKAGRDISEFINFGKMNQVDTFIRRIIEPLENGKFEGDAGKKRLKAMTREQRLKLAMTALTQKQITQLGDAQAKSFSGQVDKMRDALKQFLGRVGLPLFKAMTKLLTAANTWLSKNEKKLQDLAETLGGAVMTAFSAVAKVIKFFANNSDEARAILKALLTVAGLLIGKMLAGWILFAAPIMLVTAKIALLWYIFEKLRKWLGSDFAAAIVTVFAGVLLFNIGRVTRAVWGMVAAWRAARAAALATGGAQAAQGVSGAVAGMSSLALGPAGKAATVAGVAGAAGAAGNAGAAGKTTGGKLANAARGAGWVGAAIGAHEAMNAIAPDNWMGNAAKYIASGPIALPKLVIGKVYDAVAGDKGTLGPKLAGSSVQTNYINVNIHGVPDASEMTPAMIEELEKQMRHYAVATSGGKR